MQNREEYQQIYRIVQNNKNVPFVKEIINKKFKSNLIYAQHKGKDIILPGNMNRNQALRKNNYMEFESKSDADFFISKYMIYHQSIPVDEMNQAQYDQWRQSPEGRKYTITIQESNVSKDVEKYTAIVEQK